MRSSSRAAVLTAAVLGAVAIAPAVAASAAPIAGPAHTVYGGTPADATQYPWLAAIGTPLFGVRPDGQFCVGVLITPDEVLTAGHCAAVGQAFPQLLTVTFGRSDLNSTTGNVAHVTEIRIDPQFQAFLFEGDDLALRHDVAVLKLDRSMPGPFAPIGQPHTGPATVLGWGVTADDDLNPLLRSATVPVLDNNACATPYGADFDPGTQFCAGSTTADAAELDSGGPLLVDGRVVGLVSWGHGTAEPGYPCLYSRIPTDLEF